MSVFTVDLKNRPGELARLCEAMAGRGVNLILCATTHGEDGTVAFIADDEASAEAALADAGIGYARRPALTIRMENQPGIGAATFRKLADAGVNADPRMRSALTRLFANAEPAVTKLAALQARAGQPSPAAHRTDREGHSTK